MPFSTRILVALTLGAFFIAVLMLVAPDFGGLGPPPRPDDAVSWLTGAVTQPLFLGPLALGLVLFIWNKTRPLAQSRIREVSTLAPFAEGLSKAQKLEATRAAFAAHAGTADGLVLAELMVHAGVRAAASDIHLHPVPDGRHAEPAHRRRARAAGRCSARPSTACCSTGSRCWAASRTTSPTSRRTASSPCPPPTANAEVRISLLPTQHGEKAVMRLAGLGNKGPRLDDLNFPESVRSQLTRMLEKPQGLLFFTGPTGSGKTTSIYASVAHLQQTRGALAQIATIEDPIEFSLDGAAQTQVNRAAGLDFATGLRALLRQDPNVLVVGEIRDVETARIATQAALTGHLILTTVHADSAPGVFNRLLEMGVEPSVVASVSLACFSQRLLRRLCPHCRRPETAHRRAEAAPGGARRAGSGYSSSNGCDECGGTGVLGRAAIFEVLVVTRRAARAAQEGSPARSS